MRQHSQAALAGRAPFPANPRGLPLPAPLGLINKLHNSNRDTDDACEDHDPSDDLSCGASVILDNPADGPCQKQDADTAEEPCPPWQDVEGIHSEEDYTVFFW